MWRVLAVLYSVFSLTAFGKPLLLLSDHMPPHVIKNQSVSGDDKRLGIDLDVVRSVLIRMGYQVTVDFVPLARAKSLVMKGKADITAPTFFQQDEPKLFISDAVVAYRPTIFSHRDTPFKLPNLANMQGASLTTFQGATGYFGKEFSERTKSMHYREVADMSSLPKLLKMKRTDLVILDFYVFHYFAAKYIENYTLDYFEYQRFRPDMDAFAGFSDRQLRDEFNQELKRFIASGGVDKITAKYLPTKS